MLTTHTLEVGTVIGPVKSIQKAIYIITKPHKRLFLALLELIVL